MRILDELDLFYLGIKPALLLTCKEFRRFKSRYPKWDGPVNQYKSNQFILSNNDLNIEKLESEDELGIALGYYPESCKELIEIKDWMNYGKSLKDKYDWSYINFNGVLFNCMSKWEEAALWCFVQYGQKILREQGFILWEQSCAYTENGYKKLKVDGTNLDKILKGEILLKDLIMGE